MYIWFVKINVLNKISVLLLIAFLNVVSGMASSYPSEKADINSRDFDYLQADQNKTAIYFEEVYSLTSNERQSSNEFLPFGVISELQFSQTTLNRHSGAINFWNFLPNSRQLLSEQIFPFQFFW
jgi:hypothetical protein